MNSIQPRQIRARVLLRRTPTRRRRLLRCISDKVPPIMRIARLSLESMQKPIPVPDLVDRRPAAVVLVQCATGHGACQDVAPIFDVVGARAGGVYAWVGEGAEAEDAG